VRPLAPARRDEAWLFRSFEEGREALRSLVQAGVAPDIARLFDEDETGTTFALAGGHAVVRQGFAALGYRPGCLMIATWEGEPEDVAHRRAAAVAQLRRAGGTPGDAPARGRRPLPLGRGPGKAWRAARFAGPHLRDALLDRGVLVETLETATTWSRLGALHAAVRAALTGALAATPPVIGCHVSHLYPDGASLYFTVLARQDAADPQRQWRSAKRAAGDAIAAAGATITHHHAVGADHRAWMAAEHGALGVDLLRALKRRCDPAGVMNPGKLITDK